MITGCMLCSLRCSSSGRGSCGDVSILLLNLLKLEPVTNEPVNEPEFVCVIKTKAKTTCIST